MLSAIRRTYQRVLAGEKHAGLIRAVRPYTICSKRKLLTLINLAEMLNRQGVEGDFVECGTFNGGSAALMARCMGPQRHLWMYDSFQGMPTPGEQDTAESQAYAGQYVGSVAKVREALARVGAAPANFTIREGWFQDTFAQPLPERVALLHCDADWYDSVRLVLETFYPRIPQGGCVVLDDFGCWEGCREAFYDFCTATGEKPLLERVSRDQAYWIRGKANNRKAA